MKYRDEIHIAMMALVFSCAMFAIYAVVPKDAVVAAKARSTVTEAPETAAEAEAIRSSQEEDAGFPFILRTVTMIMMIMTILRMIPIIQTQIPILRYNYFRYNYFRHGQFLCRFIH